MLLQLFTLKIGSPIKCFFFSTCGPQFISTMSKGIVLSNNYYSYKGRSNSMGGRGTGAR